MILQQVHFDIVGGCQLKCVGCPNSMISQKIEFVSPKTFNLCLKNIKVEKINTFRLFNYGEPLLHPYLEEIGSILQKFRNKIELIEISTNAQFVNWGTMEKLLDMKIIDRIAISCDGDGTKESYERLRPPAKWEKLIDFFDKISSLKKQIAPNLEIITRTIVEKKEDMKQWEKVLQQYSIKPEYRGWKYL